MDTRKSAHPWDWLKVNLYWIDTSHPVYMYALFYVDIKVEYQPFHYCMEVNTLYYWPNCAGRQVKWSNLKHSLRLPLQKSNPKLSAMVDMDWGFPFLGYILHSDLYREPLKQIDDLSEDREVRYWGYFFWMMASLDNQRALYKFYSPVGKSWQKRLPYLKNMADNLRRMCDVLAARASVDKHEPVCLSQNWKYDNVTTPFNHSLYV